MYSHVHVYSMNLLDCCLQRFYFLWPYDCFPTGLMYSTCMFIYILVSQMRMRCTRREVTSFWGARSINGCGA